MLALLLGNLKFKDLHSLTFHFNLDVIRNTLMLESTLVALSVIRIFLLAKVLIFLMNILIKYI